MSRWASKLIFQTVMHAKSDRDARSRTQIEDAARNAIEQRADRTLTDAEWAAMRAKILEFAGILHAWDRNATTSRGGNVK